MRIAAVRRFRITGTMETFGLLWEERLVRPIVIPHGYSTPAGLHFILAQSPNLTPYQECLVKWNAINQFFFADSMEPVNGVLTQPIQPGLGMDLNDARIEETVELEL